MPRPRSTFSPELTKMSPKIGASLDPNAVTSWFWYTYPFTLGSYASCKVGQYTTCWRWHRAGLCMDDCNLPASKRVAIS